MISVLFFDVTPRPVERDGARLRTVRLSKPEGAPKRHVAALDKSERTAGRRRLSSA